MIDLTGKIKKDFIVDAEEMYKYATTHPDITKMVIFGSVTYAEDPLINDEMMHVAISIKNPTHERIVNISNDIETNNGCVWACMIDDPRYENHKSIHRAIDNGVILYDKS